MKKEEYQKSLNLLAKSSFIVFIGIFLSKLFTYLYRIFVARTFGPEVYGLIALAFSIIAFFGALGSLGFSLGLVRFIPLLRGKNEQGKINFIFNYSRKVLFISSLIISALIFLTADKISINFFHNPNLAIFLKIMSVMIPFSFQNNLLLGAIQSYEKITAYSFFFNIFQNAIRFVLILLLFVLGLGSESAPLSYTLAAISLNIAIFVYLKKFIPQLFTKSSKKDSLLKKQFFHYSIPLMFSALTGMLMSNIDSFFLGKFVDIKNVGFYNAAIPIAFLLFIIPQIFIQLFLPLTTREYGENKKSLVKELSKQTNKWIFIINLPIFLAIFLFPGVLINLIFGATFLQAENSLRILSIGYLIFSLSVVPSNLLQTFGKSKLIFLNTFFAAILNSFLNFFLIKKFGLSGAAIATSLTYAAFSSALFIETYIHTKIFPLRRKMLRIALFSIIPIVLIFYIRSKITPNIFSISLTGIIFLLSYFLIVFKFNCLDVEDKVILKLILKKISFKKH